jgi:hypothetical protein
LKQGAVRRFAGNVEVLSAGGTDADRQMVVDFVDLANPVLAPYGVSLHVIRWAPDGPFVVMGPSTLTIQFVHSSEYQSFVTDLGFPEIPDVWGVNFRVERIDGLHASVAFVFTDRPEENRGSVTAHELGHALGLTGHSPDNWESLMNVSLFWPWLAPIDRKAIRFLYGYLEYGDGPEKVRAAFDAHWRGISDD